MDIEDFRRRDGSIALQSAYFAQISGLPNSALPRVQDGASYLSSVESIFPINSRQAAAIAIATAIHIASQP